MKITIQTTLLGCLFASGCAFDVIHVEQVSTSMDTLETCDDSFVLGGPIEVTPRGGYKRELRSGTNWKCVGRITQGDVYRTRDQILTAEASNIYEANLVVSSHMIVGFYLPVEETFSPLEQPQSLLTM